MVMVRLSSGEQRYIRSDRMGTVGAVSNPDNGNTNLAKAGRNRWNGKQATCEAVEPDLYRVDGPFEDGAALDTTQVEDLRG
jgi:ribosomal protein L2